MNQIATDESVIRINGQQYCLSASADPLVNEIYRVKLYTGRKTALAEWSLEELPQSVRR